MAFLWIIIIVSSILFGFLSHNNDTIVQALSNASSNSIALCINLCGIFGLWCGIMEMARRGGILQVISKLFRPIIKRLFKGATTEEAQEAITTNLTANILGMGNAATPAGQRAIKALAKCSPKADKGKATPDMVMLLILNNSALTIVPTTVLALRAAAGSADAAGIVPFAIVASLVSTIVAVVLGLIFR